MRRAWAALAATAALAGCSGDDRASDPPATRATVSTTDEEMFDACPPITPGRLARQEIAFSGTLSIEGPDSVLWVFDVDRWYAGGDEGVVVVRGSDVGITYFQDTVERGGGRSVGDGDRLLVAGPAGPRHRGLASACLTRPWTPELAETFAQAFDARSPRSAPESRHSVSGQPTHRRPTASSGRMGP